MSQNNMVADTNKSFNLKVG